MGYNTFLMETIITKDIQQAVFYLKKSQPIAFPTETVYGLGAGVFDPIGIQNIFSIKGRPSDNPLIAHISDLDMLLTLVEEVPEAFYILAEAFMPGPLTIVLPKKREVSSLVSAGLSTIGIRMPSHPVAKELIASYGKPIAAPSANLSGKPSATRASHVLSDFQGKIPLILEGEEPQGGIESTVIKLTQEGVKILRPGLITQEEIEEIVKKPVIFANSQAPVPEAPGMKYRHYAPQAKLLLFTEKQALLAHAAKEDKATMRLFTREVIAQLQSISWELEEESFYHYLREADHLGIKTLLLYIDPGLFLKEGLLNRIYKAAGVF